jgi:murein DD-endopeptidase MepM/ murein hydrolase activator NlpD
LGFLKKITQVFCATIFASLNSISSTNFVALKNRLTLLILISFFLPLTLLAQTPRYPKGYFRWPLNLAPAIVANMGELRDNHWHMGLDIRTAQKVNQLVYASAEGYIAYVGIRPSGFGRFIKINHPNGLTTLYGHLNDFSPVLEAYVTEQQYAQQSWAVELEIPKDRFPVAKGSFIAYSGSTGGSQGPHVHFEIRDTKTDECLNPLLFGFPFQDNTPPSMVKLGLYDRNVSIFESTKKFFPLKKVGDGYVIPKVPVINTGLQKFSFALQAFDRINGSSNQDGIYSAKLYFDDELQVDFVIDSISYDETRYMNSQIDYTYREDGGVFIQHLSRLPGDRGGVYHTAMGDGVIELNDTATHDIKIEISDAYKNVSTLEFQIRHDGALATRTSPKASPFPLFVPAQVNELKRPDFEAILPAAALYDSVRPFYFRNASLESYSVSANHQLNEASIPIQGSITIRIKPDKEITESWKNKLLIKRTYRGRATVRVAREERGGWLAAEFGDFGFFQAYADVVPPSINSLGSGDTVNLSPANRIVFTPSDNFGIKSFSAELDGEWLRFTNDKSRSWIYVFDERCPYGVHELKVTVEDLVGNITTRSWWFKKYPYTPPRKKAIRKKLSSKKKPPLRKKK